MHRGLSLVQQALPLYGFVLFTLAVILFLSGTSSGQALTNEEQPALEVWSAITAIAASCGGIFAFFIYRMISQFDQQLAELHRFVHKLDKTTDRLDGRVEAVERITERRREPRD